MSNSIKATGVARRMSRSCIVLLLFTCCALATVKDGYNVSIDTNRRIVSSASLLPIESCPLTTSEPANASRLPALEVLYCWADDDLINFHFDRLLDCESDGFRDYAGRDRHFHELAQILSGRFVRTALRKFCGNRAR